MIRYGDITKISGYDVPIVDCVTFGAPCQDLSVAGKRQGMKHESLGDDETTRSGLFHEAIRIIKEMRKKDESNGRTGEFIRPRFAVYENVPGAFSSNKGEDFKIVLEAIAKIIDKDAVVPMPDKGKWGNSGCIMGDGWSIAWRVFDAQFWGVPQRRRRIALVADFGGRCAPEILFVRKGLSRDSETSRTERKTTSADAQGCIGADDRKGECYGFPLGFRPENVRCYEETATTLCVGTRAGFCNGVITLEPGIASREGGHIYEDVSGTLRANAGDNQMAVAYDAVGLDCYNQAVTGDVAKSSTNRATDSDHVPCIVMDRSAYNQGVNAKFDIGIDENGVAFSHIAKGPGAVAYIDTSHADDVVRMDDVVAPLQARDYKGGKLIAVAEEQPVICLQGNGIDRPDTSVCNGKGWKEGTSFTLNTVDRPAVAYKNPQYIVRRLTPLECERLQGFPDGWTDIGEYVDSNGKKKQSSDSSRYKALGNSISIPNWKWVLKRLCSHYERDATSASLFDGIGGFPYIWQQLNGKGTAVWASEIEEFPMAVTKARIE